MNKEIQELKDTGAQGTGAQGNTGVQGNKGDQG